MQEFVIYYEKRKNSTNIEAIVNTSTTERTPLLDSSGGSSDVVLIEPVNLSCQVIIMLFKKVG